MGGSAGVGVLLLAAIHSRPIAVAALALFALMVTETDEAFANIYSASVSIQNVFPRVSQRALSIVIGAACAGLALIVNLVDYENFLLLLGALFVPLFGVLVADYFVLRRGRYREDLLYAGARAVRVGPIAAWLVGFLAYNWINPGTVSWWVSAMNAFLLDWVSLPSPPPSWAGASLVSFVVALALTLVLVPIVERTRPVALPA
jgi:purine-cytosine permease-like protein